MHLPLRVLSHLLISFSLQEGVWGAWVCIDSSTQVAWSGPGVGMVMICEMITASKFWSHQNIIKKKIFAHSMRLSNQYHTYSLTGGANWDWSPHVNYTGHVKLGIETTTGRATWQKKQTALNNHKGRNEWWQRTRRQRAGPTAVATAGDAGRHGSRPSRSWRTRGAAGGETLAVTRGQPVGEWLSEMRGPRFGIWCACSCVGVCPSVLLHYSNFIARSTRQWWEKKNLSSERWRE